MNDLAKRSWGAACVLLTGLALVMTVVCKASYAKSSDAIQSRVSVDPSGTVHLPAFDVPLSIYMSPEAKHTYIDEAARPAVKWPIDVTHINWTADIDKLREAFDALQVPYVERAKVVYPVTIEEQLIGGIRTEVVTPKVGVSKVRRDRVLINLHGGGMVGTEMIGLLESIPIAVVAGIKVISIDYREAPEFKFPAASEDVASVYRELLKRYRHQNIGIYGCSFGGMLTTMAVAWFQKERIPLPGAIGVFCAADAAGGGDSRYLAAALEKVNGGERASPPPATPNPPENPGDFESPGYLAGLDPRDPLVSPTFHPEILARFPPTLLITGTRDSYGSSVIYAHSRLVSAGVYAELHVWEGMWHFFFGDVDLLESKEMYSVTAKFFNTRLGRSK
jgi:epsilon-lactone hydrolase